MRERDGNSHLVLVGGVKFVPGLWVVLLVPEAVNVERFRAREKTGHVREAFMMKDKKNITSRCREKKKQRGERDHDVDKYENEQKDRKERG